jgi:hypothetical protein
LNRNNPEVSLLSRNSTASRFAAGIGCGAAFSDWNATMNEDDEDEVFQKRSAWLLPAGVALVVVALSAVLMLYYLVPSGPNLFQEQVAPTSDGNIVALSLNGHTFYVPANYLEYKSTRRGGAMREIAAFALLPGFDGWSNWQSGAFADNGADSNVIYLTLNVDRNNFDEAEKLKRVYLGYVKNPAGTPGPYGLTAYEFRSGLGYYDEDLYVGETESGPMILRCVRKSTEVPSPNCLRDKLVVRGISMSVRFKRTHLPKWREIGAGTDKLLAEFERPPK